MKTEPTANGVLEPPLTPVLKAAPKVCGGVVTALGVAVLLGWWFDVPLLKSVLPESLSMKANTALAFALTGTALLLLSGDAAAGRRAPAGQLLALSAALIAALTFSQYVVGWDLGLDELLFRDDPNPVATPLPGRMAPTTAVCFVLLGVALAATGREWRRGGRLAAALAAAPLVLGVISVVEYALRAPLLYDYSRYNRMALHTASGLAVLALGVLLAQPGRGWLGALRAGPVSTGQRWMLASVALLLLLVLAGGGWFYRAQRAGLQRQVAAQLETIGHAKVGQIVQWRAERLADAAVLCDDAPLAELAERWLANPTAGEGDALLARCRSLQTHYGYNNVLLTDSQGQVRLSLDRYSGEQDYVEEAVIAALNAGHAAFADLHTCGVEPHPHLSIAAPLLSGNAQERRAVGAIVLVCDARQFLFPLIQAWPTPSRTAETLIVRGDDRNVLFLNELRHMSGAAMTLRAPLDREDLPAAMAVLGRIGVVRGRDYRGVAVLAALLPVPDSPWFMVAKMDEDEAFAVWRSEATLIMALILCLVATVAVAGLAGWQQARAGHLQALYRAEAARRESEARHGVTLMSIGDGVIVTDAHGCVTLMNPVAEALTGWHCDEAAGAPLADAFRILNEETRQTVEDPLVRVLSEGVVVGLANHTLLVARDGSERPIADSGAPVRDDQGAICGAVIVFRDQSAVREAEARDRRLATVLQASRDVNQLIAREQDVAVLTRRACEVLVEARGYHTAWIALLDAQGRLTAAAEAGLGECFDALRDLLAQGHAPGCVQELRTPGTQLIRSSGRECDGCPLRAALGDRAALGVRIEHGGRLYGMLLISLPAACVSLDEEQHLAAEIAGDLGVALHDIEADALRRQAEADLRASEQSFRAAFEQAAVGVARVATDGRWLAVNQKLCEILGYDCEELLRRNVEENTYPAGVERDWGKARQLLAGEAQSYTVEERYLRKDGAVVWVNLAVGLVRKADGQPDFFIAIVEDISERSRSAAERERLATAIEQAAEMIVITDAEGRIQYTNPAFETVTGYTRAEVLGRLPSILQSGQHDRAFYDSLWSTIRAGKTWQGRIVNQRKDGSRYTEEATISPVRDATGAIVSYVAVKRDITRELGVEAQLAQAQRMESVGRLAGGVAHDFNNLLMGIMGYLDLCRDGLPADHPVRAWLDEATATAQRSANLTRQLLAFARKQVIAPKVLDLNDTVAGMLALLHRLIGEDIDLAWVPGLDLWSVKMDPGQIDQILANLCVNARDAIGGVGRITIRTENVALDEAYCVAHQGVSPGEYALLAVSDDGCGMDREVLAHVFEPFFTTKGVGEGTGLGLATVYGIVRQNAGEITISSEPGAGTTVRVYLPRAAAATPVEDKAKASAALPRGSETILLTEDEKSLRVTCRHFLEALGYKVLVAESALAALAAAEGYQDEIHLLITDVVMPGMNGRNLAQRLQTSRPGMRYLYMSGYTSDVIAHRGVLDEGVQFLAKPFSRGDLARKVFEALGHG